MSNIKGTLSLRAIWEYLHIWDLLDGFALQPGVQDQHLWRLSGSGVYSSRPTMRFINGSIEFALWKRVWRS